MKNGNFEELFGLKTAWDQKYLDPQNLLQNSGSKNCELSKKFVPTSLDLIQL